MNHIAITIIWAEFINIATAMIFKTIMLEHANLQKRRGESDKLAFCIAGLLNQPETAFKYIELPGYTKVFVKFSPWGYSGLCLGNILRRYCRKGDIVLGISIGARAALSSEADQALLINPCCTAKSLKKGFYWLIKLLSPIAVVVAGLFGWLSFVPILPAQEGRYSLSLLVDQLFNMGYGANSYNPHTELKIITSKKDEFLDNEEIVRHFEKKDSNCGIVSIDTMHARIGDPKDATKYQKAINYLLN